MKSPNSVFIGSLGLPEHTILKDLLCSLRSKWDTVMEQHVYREITHFQIRTIVEVCRGDSSGIISLHRKGVDDVGKTGGLVLYNF